MLGDEGTPGEGAQLVGRWSRGHSSSRTSAQVTLIPEVHRQFPCFDLSGQALYDSRAWPFLCIKKI